MTDDELKATHTRGVVPGAMNAIEILTKDRDEWKRRALLAERAASDNQRVEDALREAGNLARALEQQVKELKVEVSWLKRYHVCKMDRTGPDTLFCYGCRTEMNEPEDK